MRTRGTEPSLCSMCHNTDLKASVLLANNILIICMIYMTLHLSRPLNVFTVLLLLFLSTTLLLPSLPAPPSPSPSSPSSSSSSCSKYSLRYLSMASSYERGGQRCSSTCDRLSPKKHFCKFAKARRNSKLSGCNLLSINLRSKHSELKVL